MSDQNNKENNDFTPKYLIAQTKGPFQNNGASPWYSDHVQVGSGLQHGFKMNIDSGARFIWVTSTACHTEACMANGRKRFSPGDSPTFEWVDKTNKKVDFGPWGTMLVKTGNDRILDGEVSTDFYLSTNYTGDNFAELNWSGGIGLPTGIDGDKSIENIVTVLLNQGKLKPQADGTLWVSMNFDPLSKVGLIVIGADADSIKPDIDAQSKVILPYTPYANGLGYIWTTSLDYWAIGNMAVARDFVFCHDSGSSQFKGDTGVMVYAIEEVLKQREKNQKYPPMSLKMGTKVATGETALLVLGPEQYVTEIEAGKGTGDYTINIQPLDGLKGLVLAGSILLDNVYTVYRYTVSGSLGTYAVCPADVWMYNKKNGPKIIQ